MEYRARGVAKSFGGITALSGVDFTARPRSVHALIGENGAGKSTLLKILAGAMQPDSGVLELNDERVEFHSTADALERGIAIVSQELTIFPHVDLIGNLFPLGPPTKWGLVDRSEVVKRSQGVLDELGVDRPLRTPAGELSLAEQQLLEIARAVITRPRVLILDEPTSALGREDVTHVHAVLDVLRDRDVAVVYVSHILEDVRDHVDEVTVLRDGAVALAEVPAESITMSEMITAMVGHSLETVRAPDVPVLADGPSLEVHDLAVGPLQGVSFSVRSGEIVGLAGLAGAGQQEVLDTLAGIRQPLTGEVTLPTGLRNPSSIREAVKERVALIPGDRKRFGLHLDSPVWENMAHVRTFALGGLASIVRREPLIERAKRRIEQLHIAAPSAKVVTSSLSGGNQQKVVYAKWVETDPTVILMGDPTRGIDVGGRTEVWDLIHGLAEGGAIQVVLSSDPLELASVCHRVLVFRAGVIAAELSGDRLSQGAILEAMNQDLEEAV